MSLVQETAATPHQAAAASPPSDEATARALAQGSIGKELGLGENELRVGLKLAANLIARDAHAEAFRVYMVLVLCQPTNVDFQVGLSNCAGLLGQHLVQLQAATAVITLAPKDPRGYLLSARASLGLGNLADARQDLADAERLATSPSHASIRQEAGVLLKRVELAGAA